MRTRFGYGLLCLALTLGLALSACGTGANKSPTSPVQSAPSPAPAAAPAQQSAEQQALEAAKKEGEVSMWAVTWGPEKGEMESLFQAKYPSIKVKIADVPSNETAVIKLLEELKAGRHTVDMLFLSKNLSDVRAQGQLAEYAWKTAGWPNQPNHKYWANLVVGGHVAVYNTEVVTPAEAPKTYDDMKNAKWRGRSAISTSAGDAIFRYAYMWREGDKLNWDKAESYWKELVANTRPRAMGGMTAPFQLLVAGEYAMMPNVAVGPFLRFFPIGAPVALVPLGDMPGNAFSIAILKDAPHPNATRLWADFLTTPEMNELLSVRQGNPPLNPEAARKSRLSQTLVQMNMKPLAIPDEYWTVENVQRSEKLWSTLTGIR